MELSEKLLRSFSDIIKSSAPKEKKQNPTVMGTVTDTEGGVFVQIDGSTIKTPAVTLVGVEVGDRVDVLIQNHRAVITGNRTAPAITRYGKTYTKLTDDGLIVGVLDDNDQPTGIYLLVHPDDENPENVGFKVIDPVKKALAPNDPDAGVLASFGTVATIGEKGDNQVVIQSNGVHLWGSGLNASMARFGTDMINGVPTPIIRLGLMGDVRMKFSPTSIQLIDGSTNPAKIIAEFGNTIKLGKDGDYSLKISGTSINIIDNSTGTAVATYGEKSKFKQLETDNIIVNGTPGVNARVWVQAYDSSDNMKASIQLRADVNGTIHLYDTVREKSLITESADGRVMGRLNPVKLSSMEYTPTAESSTTYVNAPIANMSDWSVIVAYVAVGNDYVACTFIKGGPSYQIVSSHNGTTVIRASVTADWSNNRLRLRCLAGTGTLYNTVHLRDVYGIVKA